MKAREELARKREGKTAKAKCSEGSRVLHPKRENRESEGRKFALMSQGVRAELLTVWRG